MNFIFFFALIIATAVAYEIIPIVKHNQDLRHDGSYYYDFETANGIKHQAVGSAVQVKGNYKYISPEGQPIELTYVADENGFQPYGAHIPAVPQSVIRALEYIRTHPAYVDDRSRRY